MSRSSASALVLVQELGPELVGGPGLEQEQEQELGPALELVVEVESVWDILVAMELALVAQMVEVGMALE